jgi:ribosomal protein S4
MTQDREIEIERWRGMTLHAQIIEWRDRAVEAEAERDRLRAALDVCEAERDAVYVQMPTSFNQLFEVNGRVVEEPLYRRVASEESNE